MPQRKVIPLMEARSKTLSKTLSIKEVEELFNREAVLFEECNGIPLHRARYYFGAKAVAYVFDLEIKKEGKRNAYYCNYCEIIFDGKSEAKIYYLTWNGFKAAATYHNVNLTAIYEYN